MATVADPKTPAIEPRVAPTVLTQFSTVAVSATPVQVIAPGSTHMYVTVINSSAAALYISNTSGVGSNATSITLPAGATLPTLLVYSTSGLWLAAPGAGNVSILLQPKA